MRKSLELSEQEWAALDRLAEVTNSKSSSRNASGGQPSWRVLIQRLANSDRAQEAIVDILQQEEMEEIVYSWENRYGDLPDCEVEKWEASLTPDEKAAWESYLESRPQEQSEIKWHAALNLHHRRALAEARRLGYEPHPELSLTTNPCVLVDFAKGYEAGKALIERWGFGKGVEGGVADYAPNSMWDIMAWRRDGDAIIAVVGDDRGWDKDWEYNIVVAWAPQRMEKLGYSPTQAL